MKIEKPICFVLLCISLLAGCATNEKISDKNGTNEKSWINIIVKEGDWCGITPDKNCDGKCPTLYKKDNGKIEGECINPVKGEKLFEGGKLIKNDKLTNKNKKEICCICSYEIPIDLNAECPTLYTEENEKGFKVKGKKSIQPEGNSKCLYWVKIFKPSELPKTTEGWNMSLLDDCKVEYRNQHGEIWIWDPKLRRWTPPLNHPDPNPITPEGERLGGKGSI